MVTKTPSDEYVFKVPTLRNVALTAPYFHTGQAWDLRQAVAVMGASQLGIKLTDDEIDKITAFLDSLTGEYSRRSSIRSFHRAVPARHGRSRDFQPMRR
jgi:cytochrome c peroxidase